MLDMELERARRAGRPLSVIVGDLDSFSAVNERQGHAAGDVALQLVASDCLKWKRRIDQAARIGGEEFALLTPGTGTREALLIADRLRVAVAALDVLPAQGVTVSAGLAAWPADGHDGDALRRAADEALYRAKAAGKNRCELAGEAPSLA
jgi:diguanylate cyclase (GGDEF)-like protein